MLHYILTVLLPVYTGNISGTKESHNEEEDLATTVKEGYGGCEDITPNLLRLCKVQQLPEDVPMDSLSCMIYVVNFIY